MKTKTLHFVLYGNTLSRDIPPRVLIEDVSRFMAEEGTDEKEIAAQEYFYNHHPTLRDIAVLLYECCGQGVMWNLSRELADRLKLNKKDVQIVMDDIIKEYASLTEEEALEKYEEKANYIKTK